MKFCLSLIAILILATGCRHSTEPVAVRGPREYTWDVSTLAYPNSASVTMTSIWASSPTDVYVCGSNSLGPLIYHFDGKQWLALESMPNVASRLREIRGFAGNDMWTAGETSFYDQVRQRYVDSAIVLHFDGTTWTEVLPSRAGVRGLWSLWGTSAQNMFFGSLDGKVIHYDGSKWSVDTLYLGLAIDGIGGDQSHVFASGNTWKGANDSAMSLVRDGASWSRVDVQQWGDFQLTPKFGLRFYVPEQGVYYCCASSGIFRWQSDHWINIFSDVYSAFVRLGGTGSKNIFAVGWSGLHQGPVVYHWDGVDWAEIGLSTQIRQQLKSVEFYDAWTDGKEAFIVGNDGAISYILHGK